MNASLARRAILVAALAGAVLSTVPGRASDPTGPVLIASSVEGGFSGRVPIAARFDRTLDLNATSVTLRDANSTLVGGYLQGTSSGVGPQGDSLIFSPFYGEMRETASPYTVTIVAAGAGAPSVTSTSTLTFTFDLEQPVAVITSPSDPHLPHAVTPLEAFTLSGHAYDVVNYDHSTGVPVARTANVSGLVGVEIQLYRLDPAVKQPSASPGTPPTVSTEPPGVTPGQMPSVNAEMPQLSREAASRRHRATLAECTRGADCVSGEQAWTANVEGLTPGSWTARAYAIDAAGNRSKVAETSFLVA